MDERPKNVHNLFITEAEAIERAMRKAVRHALLIHKRAGVPASAWIDGRLVIIPPEEIEDEGESDDD